LPISSGGNVHGITVDVGVGVIGGSSPSNKINTGVGVAVTMLTGVGVGVPVVRAWAVANKAMTWAVAGLDGVGVDVTTNGVTQLEGNGVGMPARWAWAVAATTMVAAAKTDSGVGVAVIRT